MQGDGRRRWSDERKKGTMWKGRKNITILNYRGIWWSVSRSVVIRASSARVTDTGRGDAFNALLF